MIHPILKSQVILNPDRPAEVKSDPHPHNIDIQEIFSPKGVGKDLKKNNVIDLNDPSKQSSETRKSNWIGKRMLSWVAGTKVSIWAMANFFKSIRFCMLNKPSTYALNQLDKNLEQLSHSELPAQAIHALSPAIAAGIQKMLVETELHGSYKVFFESEYNALHTLVDTLLLRIYLNMAKKIKESPEGETQSVQQPVSFADVVSGICEIVNRHLSYINQRFETIKKADTNEKRNRIICSLFSGMVDEFLTIALPNGVKEFPLTLTFPLKGRWESFQKQVLPHIFYEIYRQLATPLHQNQKEILLQKPGGISLVSLAQMLGDQATDVLPKILADATVETCEDGIVTTQETPFFAFVKKSFPSLLSGPSFLKDKISEWFKQELVGVGKSENLDLKQLWKLLGGYIEPLLIHIFMSMSQIKNPIDTKGRMPDVMGIICIRFLTICSKFFNCNHQKIQTRIQELIVNGKPYKDDSILLEIFQPLANNLLCMMGLNDPINLPLPDVIKKTFIKSVKEAAPGFLLRQYFAITNSTIDDDDRQKKLRSLLFDPKNLEDPTIAIKVVSALHAHKEFDSLEGFQEFYQKLWAESGTEDVAKTLEEMCTVFSSQIVNSVMRYFGVSDQKSLKVEHNPFMAGLYIKIKKLVEIAFLEILTHVVENVEGKAEETEAHPKSLVAIHAILQLIEMTEKRMKGLKKELTNIAQHSSSHDSEVYDQKASKLFERLATDLHEFLGVNPFKHLPLNEFPCGESLKDVLWESIKKAILPHLLYKAYSETLDWRMQLDDSYQELEKSYHSSHPKWACKVLAQYATDFTQHYLQNSDEEIAKVLFENIKAYFNDLKDSSAAFVVKKIDDIKTGTETLFKQNIAASTRHHDFSLSRLRPFLINYFEAIIAKYFAEFSKTIREIELENPDLTVDIAIQLLKDTAEHFAIVTKVTEESGLDQGFQVPLSDVLSAFGKNLHDGVPLNPSDSNEAKDLIRLQGCFIPLAVKLLKLANLTVTDFPMPSWAKEPLGELFVNKIFPLILLKAYQKASEPQMRNVLMLRFVETLYAALNGIPTSKEDNELKEASSHPDIKQRHLYETCGSVVLELVKLIPDTTVQYVFMKEKVKNMSAEAIGDAMMPYLSRWTLLQVIDTMIYSGLPSFHPSKWEGKLGREELVPRKVCVRPDGKRELKLAKDFEFDFPTNPIDLKMLNLQKVKEEEKVRKELRNGFTKTISQQLYVKAWMFIKSLWASLQAQLNDFIEGRFSENGQKIKAILDKIFSKIFFDICGSVIQFLTTPITALIKYFVEKTIIDHRSEDVIENLQSEAFENLFYKWIDGLVDALVKLQKKPAAL